MHRLIPALLLVLTPACHAAVTDADVRAVAGASDAFACDLYGRLAATPDTNLAFAPFSLSSALNMTSLGAGGKTADEFAKVLHQPDHPAFHAIAGGLPQAFAKLKDFTFVSDNRVWLHRDLPVQPAFTDALKARYAAPATRLDFTDPVAARKTINEAVADATNKRITDVIPDAGLTPASRLVLTNALYFRGAWDASFPKAATSEDDFHISSERTAKVPMMHQTARYRVAQTEQYQAVELPYKANRLAMLILVPREGHTLANV